jgi:hypothetical protein
MSKRLQAFRMSRRNNAGEHNLALYAKVVSGGRTGGNLHDPDRFNVALVCPDLQKRTTDKALDLSLIIIIGIIQIYIVPARYTVDFHFAFSLHFAYPIIDALAKVLKGVFHHPGDGRNGAL